MRPIPPLAIAVLVLNASSVAAEEPTLRSLTLRASPAGAEVYIDGQIVGRAPIDLPIPVAPGEHTLKVTKPGYAPYLDVFSVRGRKAPPRIEVELVPVQGVLRVATGIAGAHVSVDGRYLGDTPFEGEIDVGRHLVTIAMPGFRDETRSVAAIAGQEMNLELALVPAPIAPSTSDGRGIRWYERGWFWGAVTAAAVVVAGGAVTAAVVANQSSGPLDGADVKYDLRGAGAR